MVYTDLFFQGFLIILFISVEFGINYNDIKAFCVLNNDNNNKTVVRVNLNFVNTAFIRVHGFSVKHIFWINAIPVAQICSIFELN